MMGWSHGGYITLISVFRDKHPFKAAAAMVPVTNLVFRLSYKGPSYQRQFSTQARIQGLPFEKRDLYIERSPLYHVDKLQVPLLVHVATNDTDVNFVEDQQIVDALRSRKPDLAETKIYVDPVPGPASVGHTFNRRINTEDAGARRLTRPARFVEPHLDVLRMAPSPLRRPQPDVVVAVSSCLRRRSRVFFSTKLAENTEEFVVLGKPAVAPRVARQADPTERKRKPGSDSPRVFVLVLRRVSQSPAEAGDATTPLNGLRGLRDLRAEKRQ